MLHGVTFKIGMTFACFQFGGNLFNFPFKKNLNFITGKERIDAYSLRTLDEKSSGSPDFQKLIDFR